MKKHIVIMFALLVLSAAQTTAQQSAWAEIPSGTSADIYGIDFTPNGVGWAVTFNPAQVLKSEESGLGWDVDYVFPGITKVVEFTDDLHGWVAGVNINTNKPTLFNTQDGGETWDEVSLSSQAYQSINSFQIVDGTGFVFGNNGYSKRCTNPFGMSQNWTTFSVPTQENIWNAYFSDSETILICSDNLYRKSNGTWWTVYPGDVWEVEFVNLDVGYGITPSSVIKTTDGGVLWTEVSQHPIPQGSVLEIAVVTETEMYIGGIDGKIYISEDGGVTWQVDYDPLEARLITQLKLINSNLWATGREGLILFKQNVANGIQSHAEQELVTVYPNPATTNIRIQLPQGTQRPTHTHVYDITGRLVHQQSFTTDMDVSTLSRGTYAIVVHTEQGNYRGMIQKQ